MISSSHTAAISSAAVPAFRRRLLARALTDRLTMLLLVATASESLNDLGLVPTYIALPVLLTLAGYYLFTVVRAVERLVG